MQSKGNYLAKFILCAWVVCFLIFTGPVEVKAEVIENLESHTINPGEYHNVSMYLNRGELLYARFRITDGEGIYFFIVDQDGQDAIMNGSEPTTRYEENTYSAHEAWLYMVFHIIPHNSTWYVWFSKVNGVPNADSAATIEAYIGRDTDGPFILETHIPEGPLTGTIEVSFRVYDDAAPIWYVALLVNDIVVIDLPPNAYISHETEDITGFYVEGVVIWDTTQYENSVYVLKIVASDDSEHYSESAGVLRTVNNGFFDYPIIKLIITVAIISVTGLSFAWYNKKHNTRLYAYLKTWKPESWVIIIITIISLLIIWFILSNPPPGPVLL